MWLNKETLKKGLDSIPGENVWIGMRQYIPRGQEWIIADDPSGTEIIFRSFDDGSMPTITKRTKTEQEIN